MATFSNELLDIIFSYLADKRDTISQLRLVSRQFAALSSPYMFINVGVHINSASLERCEQLCNHKTFSRSIQQITINIGDYTQEIVAGQVQFVENQVSSFHHQLSVAIWKTRCMTLGGSRLHLSRYKEAQEICFQGRENPYRQLAYRLWMYYVDRCLDQGKVRKNNQHISRLCRGIKRLTRPLRLYLTDDRDVSGKKELLKALSTEDLKIPRDIMDVLHFNTQGAEWYDNEDEGEDEVGEEKPESLVEMLGTFCADLGGMGIQLNGIVIRISFPSKHVLPSMTSEQQANIRKLVSNAIEVVVLINDLAIFNHELSPLPHTSSARQLLALGPLTSSLFSGPNIRELCLDLGGHVYNSSHVINLDNFIAPDQTWDNLRAIELSGSPFKVQELTTLLRSHSSTLEEIRFVEGWLLSGTWKELLDVLRTLEKLNRVYLLPYGELSEYDYKWVEKVQDFATGRSSENPLAVSKS